ncbi:primosomal protein N' (replication factor Y) (superfamily II helicase) (plasmid) [Legionella adelaidensis]|uniref:Replication restart protein PriA n=1 Tax=Legionella adelaidensis TaxID=45056 RepID=A0A0W0R1B3_9GAMM|nr:primosomal protein N' [Legionella adelaidensis]KTC64837.1 primosomal protein N' (replication factor Y) [Legionella adelaidensis]VEH82992.1 primosomal protein N' (replication factor Y) (superfamily II helicase) [Legionella adelaidensis]
MPTVLKVCIPNTLRNYFHYFPGEKIPLPGARVRVPFRNRDKIVGVVIGEEKIEDVKFEIKQVEEIIDATPLIPLEILNLCSWISTYYQSPLSEVISLALPKKYREGKGVSLPLTKYYSLNSYPEHAHAQISSRAKKIHGLIDLLINTKSKEQIQASGFSMLQLKTLIDKNLVRVQEEVNIPGGYDEPPSLPLPLNEEQNQAVRAIKNALTSYSCFLLYGVTGSGKTEVYLQVIADVINAGKQVLILVPEIGLTPQLLSRFTRRFRAPLVVIHSNLNDTERQEAWQLAAFNHAKIIIGTRSAIFTPLPNLGLIVVDEEHDSSFKQMEGVRYSARDTALIRAYQANIPIILGSATPSLETLYNSASKYQLFRLTQKALSSTPLHYQIVDTRNQRLEDGLAAITLKKIGQHLEKGNQVLVFINRRGFAPVLLCHSCGWMADCRACDSHLTLHKKLGKLICHHCGLTQHIIVQCKHCQSQQLFPLGVGTQRVFEFLKTRFDTSILRIDRDEIQQKNALNERLAQINAGEVKLIVGTQMLAKGHHFPNLSLVVILDADNGFYNQDFRGIERLGQLITQVAGRAGREKVAGEVVIQTYLPQHPLLNTITKEGYPAFATQLLAMRQAAALPPFSFMALIRAKAKRQNVVLTFLHTIKEKLMEKNLEILGPAPAPLSKKAHFYRMQLMVKSPSRKRLQAILSELREIVTQEKLNKGIQWSIDVDPVDLS